MNPSIKSMTGFPLGILSAMMVTVLLFMTLPMLTRISITPSTGTPVDSFLIEKWKPSPPPPETRDETKKQILPEKEFADRKEPITKTQPKFDVPRGNLPAGINGAVDIGIPVTIHEIVAIPELVYKTGEVDQSPRLLRQFPPQYPYIAKRDNIEGWVILRFVVDTEGNAKDIEVAASDPADVFEAAALQAVARYKFKPAMKNGAAVNCIIRQRIRFTLD